MSNKIVPAALAMAVAGGVLLGGCGAARQRPFEPVFGTGVGPLVTRPGGEFGYLFGLIKNRSHTTVTIDSVSLRGPGVGTVITLPDVRLAPIGAGLSIEQSNYVTDPTITSTGPRGCCKQALKPVAGYRLQPGAGVRVWVVVRARKPGRRPCALAASHETPGRWLVHAIWPRLAQQPLINERRFEK